MLKVSKKMLIYVVGKKPRCRYENLKDMPFAKLLLKTQIEVLAYMVGRLLDLAEDDEGIEEKDLIQLVSRIGHYFYYIISRRCTKDVSYRHLARGTDLFTNSRVYSLWFPASREQHTDTFGRFQEFISCINSVYNTYTIHRGSESISMDLSYVKHNFSYMITYLMNDLEALVKRKYPEYDAELLPKTEKKAKKEEAPTPIAATPVVEERPRRARAANTMRTRVVNPYFEPNMVARAYPFMYAPMTPIGADEQAAEEEARIEVMRDVIGEVAETDDFMGVDEAEAREERGEMLRMPRLDELMRPMRDMVNELRFDYPDDIAEAIPDGEDE